MRAFQILIVLIFLSNSKNWSQVEYVMDDDSLGLSDHDCNRFSARAAKKCDKLATRIKKTTDAALSRYRDAEDQILHSMCNIDERHAESLMQTALYSFRRMECMLKREATSPLSQNVREFDQIESAICFIDKTNICSCNGLDKLRVSQANLKSELKRSEIIQSYIKERTSYLKEISKLYPGLDAQFAVIDKLTYYMEARTGEYFRIFSDRASPEKLFFLLLGKNNAFADFSQLSGISGGVQPSLTPDRVKGQSMEQALTQLQAAAESQGLNPAQIVNPSGAVSDSKEGLDKLSDNLNETSDRVESTVNSSFSREDQIISRDSSSTNSESEEWKPNPLRTKRFIDRFYYGFNIQTSPNTKLFPTSATISGNLSYQVTTRSNLGFGMSYIMGFQKPSVTMEGNRVTFISSNGYNIRSYSDFNFHRNLFFQINYEWSYRATIENHSRPAMHNSIMNGATDERLVSLYAGLKLKTPSTKRTQKTLEILYDFMHIQTGQPAIVIRMGMEFLPKHGYKR